MRGIVVVSFVHSDGEGGDFYPIDYRVYAPHTDGKTKKDHLAEMFVNANDHKCIQARTILFGAWSWYASDENLKLIHQRKWTFFTTLKSNRLVSMSKEQGYIHLDEIDWTEERLRQGVIVKLKEVPFKVPLFKLVAPHGDIDWVITNDLNDLDETLTAQVAEDASDVRWQVEELHRGLKQLTGGERCQCRTGRAQRNHLACCYHAWVYHNVRSETSAMQVEIITIYVICDDYLQAMQYRDDAQADMTTAEVMTTAVVVARFFKNCLEHARVFLKEESRVPQMLSQSRLNFQPHRRFLC